MQLNAWKRAARPAGLWLLVRMTQFVAGAIALTDGTAASHFLIRSEFEAGIV